MFIRTLTSFQIIILIVVSSITSCQYDFVALLNRIELMVTKLESIVSRPFLILFYSHLFNTVLDSYTLQISISRAIQAMLINLTYAFLGIHADISVLKETNLIPRQIHIDTFTAQLSLSIAAHTRL